MKIVNTLLILTVLVYCVLFFEYNPTPLFTSVYAGQDARQQLFPLYSYLYPEIFEDDLIYRSMRAYLGPLHLLIARVIIHFTQSPILTGFYIMALQLILIALFLFLVVRKYSSTAVACFSLIWFVHTPWLIRNTFGGLPRGWAGPILASFLYFLSVRNHKAIVLVLLLGCMLHPHSTFLAALCYGLFLSIEFLSARTRAVTIRPLIMFLLACPVLFGVTFFSVQRSPDIGKMVTLTQAKKMPAFSKRGGRFPFVPLDSPVTEFKRASLRVFFSFEGKVTRQQKSGVMWGLGVFFGAALLYQMIVRRIVLPKEMLVFGIAITTAYFLARQFAFQLYVPVRYLSWPPALFFLISIPVVVWRFFSADAVQTDGEKGTINPDRIEAAPLAILALLTATLFLTGGTSLGGRTNYREGRHFADPLYRFVREQTPRQALFAGHPSHIDGMQLYGVRRAYITTETAHPFFDAYNDEVERRLRLTFEMLYARDAREFVRIAQQEKIDYFVFAAKYFKKSKKPPPTFENARYFLPHDALIQELASFPADQYLYFSFRLKDAVKPPPFIVYRSKEAIIVDIGKLRAARIEADR